MNPIARVPLAFAVVGLLVACAAPGESSTASAESTARSPSASSAPTGPPSVAPTPSDEPDASSGEDAATIEIVGFVFAPAELTISAGTEVTFTNFDDYAHTATAGTADDPKPAVFDSGRLAKDDSFSFVFTEAGTFRYYCAVHPAMEGSITVEE